MLESRDTSIEQGVPASDCAAEVVEIGSAVTDFTTGDNVSANFDLDNLIIRQRRQGIWVVVLIVFSRIPNFRREYSVSFPQESIP
jgi:NADPH:quinone reductase-like Zn-dependent oxidoreductase